MLIGKDKLGLVRDYDVPGFVLKGPEHTFGYGVPFSQTLAGKLWKAIWPLDPANKLEITTKMKEVYLQEGLGDLWAVAKQWLDLQGVPTPP